MTTPAQTFRGVIVPMVTPLTPDGGLDAAAVGRVVEHLIAGGVHGVFVLGTTGESASVPARVRAELVEAMVEAVSGRVRTLAGVSGNCLSECIEAARDFRRAGVDAVVAHPPFYFPLSEREIEAWFAALADAADLPLLLYNIPQTTRLSIPLDAVERLSAHPNVAGIKDSAADAGRLGELLRRVGGRDDFAVLVGAGGLYAEGLRQGAHGIVPSMGNLAPAACRALYDAARRGDERALEGAQRAALSVAEEYQKGRLLGESLAALKSMMAARGLCGPTVLPPLLAAEDEPGAPIRVAVPEGLDFRRTDGGLPPAPGLRTAVVFRADAENPAGADGRGWTYHHHPDIACWKGRLYVAWNACERDEDTWPSREVYSTSEDGERWSRPAELFPQGVSTPLRMYFYHSAAHRRMLAVAGLRTSHERTREQTKGPLVVREIRADHTLGPVFTLRPPDSEGTAADNPLPPSFDSSTDAGFVGACRELLANRLFLEQQDYGRLLAPADRMPWHDPAAWPQGDAPEDFGKALCIFPRPDGALVALGKKRWVSVSRDDGATWTLPVRPRTLVTGMGKVWGQRTPDGRCLLAYNPHDTLRYPLVVVTGDDGVTFGDMHPLHGELPAKRYEGRAKSPGASYVRGLSLWSDDFSRHGERAAWLVYSVHKEEIWVSRLPY